MFVHRSLSQEDRARDGDGGGGGGSGGPGLEWITVDQLDHSLRTCHLARRALDPQVSVARFTVGRRTHALPLLLLFIAS